MEKAAGEVIAFDTPKIVAAHQNDGTQTALQAKQAVANDFFRNRLEQKAYGRVLGVRNLLRIPLDQLRPAMPSLFQVAACDGDVACNEVDAHEALEREARSEEHTSELQSRENLVCRH